MLCFFSVYEKLKLKIFIFIITCSNRLMYDELVLNQICSNKFFFFSFLSSSSLWLDFKDRQKNVIKKFYHLFFGKKFLFFVFDERQKLFFEFLLIYFGEETWFFLEGWWKSKGCGEFIYCVTLSNSKFDWILKTYNLPKKLFF